MRQTKQLFLAVSLFSFSAVAFANNEKTNPTEPVILGSVINASTKKPLKGVTVLIKSAKGENLVESDECGNFKIPVVKGEVVIVLEKKGFKTFRSKKLCFTEGVLNKINFDLSTSSTEDSDIFHPLSRMMDTW